jgi:hypothetical protein
MCFAFSTTHYESWRPAACRSGKERGKHNSLLISAAEIQIGAPTSHSKEFLLHLGVVSLRLDSGHRAFSAVGTGCVFYPLAFRVTPPTLVTFGWASASSSLSPLKTFHGFPLFDGPDLGLGFSASSPLFLPKRFHGFSFFEGARGAALRASISKIGDWFIGHSAREPWF